MPDKCPMCGEHWRARETDENLPVKERTITTFWCGSTIGLDGKFLAGEDCKESQLANLKAELERVRGELIVTKSVIESGRELLRFDFMAPHNWQHNVEKYHKLLAFYDKHRKENPNDPH